MTSATKMPVLFLGHGNPMNAIDKNDFTERLEALGREVPRPKAVLCVSAHWMTEGTWITHMRHPKTIHDFYGFPPELFEVKYAAPGDPELAERIKAAVESTSVNLDDEMWGLDHGTWSVLKHMYPKADIPVLQLSLHMEQPAAYHFQLGQDLRALREEGILIVGSGNVVHNLRQIEWETHAKPFDWAVEFDEWVKDKILKRDFSSLIEKPISFAAGKLAVPTFDHYYPLLYVLGAADENEKPRFEFEGIQNASISMRCVSYGLH